MSDDKNEETYKLGIIEKLVQASKLIGHVKKDGENKFQHYSFQSEGAIKDAVKNAIETVGISIIPSYTVSNQYDQKSAKGGNNHFVDVMGKFTITDGEDEVVGYMPGSGQDSGEKAMAKACTSAQKYFYKQLFNITDKDEDPDATNSQGSYRQSNSRPTSNQYSNRSSQSNRSSGQSIRPRQSSQTNSRPVTNNQPARQATSPAPKADTAKEAAIEAQKKALIVETKRIAKSMNSDGKTVLRTLFATANMIYSQKSWGALTVAQLNHLVGAARKMGVTD